MFSWFHLKAVANVMAVQFYRNFALSVTSIEAFKVDISLARFVYCLSVLSIGCRNVNVTTNSPSQDYTHPDHHTLPPYHMFPGFKTIYNEEVMASEKK